MSVHNLIAAAVLAAGLALGAAPAMAEEAHSHDGQAGAVELALDNGAKWQTDDALRQGMSEIRNEMAAALPLIHGGDFTSAQYAELAGKIDGHIEYLVTNCKLSPEADEQLHVVLVEAMDGAAAMKAETGQMQGAARIVAALQLYPDYFDHPGWQALAH